jgi:hypothetical protein
MVFAALLALPAAAQVPQLTPFSADMHMSTTHGSEGGRDINGKMYVTQGHIRMDMDTGPHGASILITNMASQTTDMLMPQQHMYMEFNANQAMMAHRPGMAPNIKPYHDPSNPCAAEEGATCKNMGVEQVNGRSCDHWQITSKSGKVSNVWIDQKLHFPIKSVNEDSTWELTNIKDGEPAASLFEIPAGYHKMDMGQMMQGMHPPSQ